MTCAFILLAGSSQRFGGNTPKQFIKIKNKYLFEFCLDTFDSLKEIEKIFLVCDKTHLVFLTNFIKTSKYNHEIGIILGGQTRQESVYNSLKAMQNSHIFCDYVLFHDACRPLVRRHEILNLLNELKTNDGASLAVPLYDSLCKGENKIIASSLDRKNLVKLQTPQGFKFDIIYSAHERALKNGELNFTDDTSLLTKLGSKVKLVEGSAFNFKITTSEDLLVFKKIVEGFNFD